MNTLIKKLPFTGEYQELVKVTNISNRDKPRYHDGFVLFTYDFIKKRKDYYQPVAGLVKSRDVITIKTYDSLDFKTGDKIRLNGFDLYKVQAVDTGFDDKYKSTIAKFPAMRDKYSYKILELV